MRYEQIKRFMEEVVPFNRWLGVQCPKAENGFCRLEIPFREELVGDPHRPALHGGVISMLVDTAGGGAVWTTSDDDRTRVATIDLRIDYLRPARLDRLIAEANVVRVGNRVGVTDMRVFHPGAEGEPIATGKGVYNVVLKGAGSSRSPDSKNDPG